MNLNTFGAWRIKAKSGVVVFTIVLPEVYAFTKFGKTDDVGRAPLHHIQDLARHVADQKGNIEKASLNEEDFTDFFPFIINDVFENTKYYSNRAGTK